MTIHKFEEFLNEQLSGTLIAFLIDAEKKEISEVEINKKDPFKDCYKLMKVDMIEHATYYDKDVLLVDEEGLINGTKYGFKFNGVHYVGNAILIGNKGTNYGNVTSSIDKVKSITKF